VTLRLRSLAASLCCFYGGTAAAIGPPVPLDPAFFDYSSDSFIGENFGFASKLQFSSRDSQGNTDSYDTGLLGNVIAPETLGDAAASFGSGMPVPGAGLGLDDLFPDGMTPPATIESFFNQSDIAGNADAMGFTNVAVNHRAQGVVMADGDTTESQFSQLFSQFIFTTQEFGDPDGSARVEIEFSLESLSDIDNDAQVSEGFGFELLKFLPNQNHALIKELGGFCFTDSDTFLADVQIDGEDMTDLLTTQPAETDSLETALIYSIEIDLAVGETYGINLSSDFAATVLGEGFASLDSTQTITASVTVLDDNARLVLPNAVPEPGTLGLATFLSLGLVRRRRR